MEGPRLCTRQSLAGDLRRLGLTAGDTILVHASMRSLGWVCGGPTTVVHALLDVLGPAGTVVVPAQTPHNRDPSRWPGRPVPESWWPEIRAQLPAFDPALTPCGPAMGALAERVRTWPGAVRSAHPQTSFAALGPAAQRLMAGHALASPLGEESPLARLEEVDARVLLLGVGYDRCTVFHLAEYRQPDPAVHPNACVVATPSGRAWVNYETVLLDDHDFPTLGADFERVTGAVLTGPVGAAYCRLLPARAAIDFATGWLPRHRAGGRSRGTTLPVALRGNDAKKITSRGTQNRAR